MISMKKISILSQLAATAALVFAGSVAQADEVKGNAAAGNGKVWLCIGCHSIPDYRAYIASALAAYKKGERKHPTMRSIAASLSDQDMADIGEYYAAQTASSPNNPLK